MHEPSSRSNTAWIERSRTIRSKIKQAVQIRSTIKTDLHPPECKARKSSAHRPKESGTSQVTAATCSSPRIRPPRPFAGRRCSRSIDGYSELPPGGAARGCIGSSYGRMVLPLPDSDGGRWINPGSVRSPSPPSTTHTSPLARRRHGSVPPSADCLQASASTRSLSRRIRSRMLTLSQEPSSPTLADTKSLNAPPKRTGILVVRGTVQHLSSRMCSIQARMHAGQTGAPKTSDVRWSIVDRRRCQTALPLPIARPFERRDSIMPHSGSQSADGGETGIRTLETVSRLHAFQACAFDHSATSPAHAP